MLSFHSADGVVRLEVFNGATLRFCSDSKKEKSTLMQPLS